MNKPTPLTDAFIAGLKEKMKSLKIRQRTLAGFLGTTPQYVHCWFKSPRIRNPNGETILKIQQWDEIKKE